MSKSGRKDKPPKSLMDLEARRTPGLDGTFSDTCIGCLRPTDTALGFVGELEWHAAGLMRFGLPLDEAMATVVAFLDEMSGGPGPDGRYVMTYRVCRKCAARTPAFPRPVLAIPGERIPLIGQP